MNADVGVNDAIVKVVLPQLYQLIDDILGSAALPKELELRARKSLPPQYKHSIVKQWLRKPSDER